MKTYLTLLDNVLRNGARKEDRTGTGTLSLFGWQSRYSLQDGFPLLTTKKLHFKSIAHELLWFLRGETNVRSLQAEGVTIWDEWADDDGELGPVYGKQWRHWENAEGGQIDQMQELITCLKENPDSRRMLVSAWNVGDLAKMKLQPCHVLMQFYVCDGQLSCQFYQRSADVFIGVPFNIASYALLLAMLAQVCGLQRGELIHTIGDAHLYLNHLEQAKTQLQRIPGPLASLELNPDIKDLFAFRYQDIHLQDYQPQEAIAAPVAV